MPVAQLVEHLTFNQGVRDSNSRGRTKKHQTIFVRCFFVVSFKILNIVFPFWLLSPLFISSRSLPPSRTGWRRIQSVPVATMAGNNAQDSTTRWQYAPASAAFLKYIRSRLGDALCRFHPYQQQTPCRHAGGSPACGTVLCCIRLLSGYCFFLASCLPTAHSQSNAAAARAGYTIRPNSWYQVGMK